MLAPSPQRRIHGRWYSQAHSLSWQMLHACPTAVAPRCGRPIESRVVLVDDEHEISSGSPSWIAWSSAAAMSTTDNFRVCSRTARDRTLGAPVTHNGFEDRAVLGASRDCPHCTKRRASVGAPLARARDEQQKRRAARAVAGRGAWSQSRRDTRSPHDRGVAQRRCSHSRLNWALAGRHLAACHSAESRGSGSASTGHALPAPSHVSALAASAASAVMCDRLDVPDVRSRGDRCPGQASASAPARRAFRAPPARPAGYG